MIRAAFLGGGQFYYRDLELVKLLSMHDLNHQPQMIISIAPSNDCEILYVLQPKYMVFLETRSCLSGSSIKAETIAYVVLRASEIKTKISKINTLA